MPVCLAVHATLHLTSEPSPLQPWSPLRSSDQGVLTCTSTPHDDGAITATCTALRSGTATITTVTTPKLGGPSGPQQFQWQLTITVSG
ncbi:hypothetical protein F0L68_04720 [Solihabitans fulvus]|uniref:Ig-like domain-containing protein n=1 Tax=Solihabitans fulvus TaxID=1892852 RepID=A0A5B2XPQ4_9PSEU|nr:hypothetical protein [Solihabitans fulvus]KAA2265373.1 hypothetical protein F0L68_04720 [Solihabitans fulvus]